MTKVNASQKALEKIMKGEVKQRPRLFFVIKNILLWTFGILSMIAGALFVSVIIFTVMNSDMDLHREVYGYAISCITLCTVLVWFVLFGAFVILCDVSVRHTKRGYVYPLRVILLIHIGASILFGAVLYVTGIGCYVDDILGANMRFYYDVEKRRAASFHVPDKGFVMGRIVQRDDQVLEVVSPQGDQWTIAIANISPQKQEHLRDSEYAVFLGTVNDRNIFIACDVKMRNLSGVRFERIVRSPHEAIMAQHMEQQEKVMQLIRELRSGVMDPCADGMYWHMR